MVFGVGTVDRQMERAFRERWRTVDSKDKDDVDKVAADAKPLDAVLEES